MQLNRQLSKQVPQKTVLELQVLTWAKDSHGLFDYEDSKHTIRRFKIEGPCKIFRNWISGETKIVSNQDVKRGIIPDENYSFLMSCTLNRNGNNESFFIGAPQKPFSPIMNTNQQEDAEQGPINTNTYLVARYLKSADGKHQGHALSPGDIIKMGRMQYLVLECRTHQRTHSIRQTNHLGQKNGVHKCIEDFEGTCKFCLGDEITEDNFLISPCDCKGSCSLVHVNCLKTWIQSKVKKESLGIAMTINFTKFQCQLCKVPFPKIVQKGPQKIQMLVIEKPNKPYIIFQNLNEKAQRSDKQQKNLHLITADQNNVIKLGRGHQCQIRMSDISVSRIHAEIRFRNNQFYIVDNTSKFGTLIKLKHKMQIDHQLNLQCGRSTYTFNQFKENKTD